MGHSHDRLDAIWGLLSQLMKKMDCLSPLHLSQMLKKQGHCTNMDNPWAYGAVQVDSEDESGEATYDFSKCGVPVVTHLEQVIDMKVMARACQIEDGLHNHQNQHAFRFLKLPGERLPVCYYKNRPTDKQFTGPISMFLDPETVLLEYPLNSPLRPVREIGGDEGESCNSTLVGYLRALERTGVLTEVLTTFCDIVAPDSFWVGSQRVLEFLVAELLHAHLREQSCSPQTADEVSAFRKDPSQFPPSSGRVHGAPCQRGHCG